MNFLLLAVKWPKIVVLADMPTPPPPPSRPTCMCSSLFRQLFSNFLQSLFPFPETRAHVFSGDVISVNYAAAKPRWRQESHYTVVTALIQNHAREEENYSKLVGMAM